MVITILGKMLQALHFCYKYKQLQQRDQGAGIV